MLTFWEHFKAGPAKIGQLGPELFKFYIGTFKKITLYFEASIISFHLIPHLLQSLQYFKRYSTFCENFDVNFGAAKTIFGQNLDFLKFFFKNFVCNRKLVL